jgi:hypothetical protein
MLRYVETESLENCGNAQHGTLVLVSDHVEAPGCVTFPSSVRRNVGLGLTKTATQRLPIGLSDLSSFSNVRHRECCSGCTRFAVLRFVTGETAPAGNQQVPTLKQWEMDIRVRLGRVAQLERTSIAQRRLWSLNETNCGWRVSHSRGSTHGQFACSSLRPPSPDFEHNDVAV